MHFWGALVGPMNTWLPFVPLGGGQRMSEPLRVFQAPARPAGACTRCGSTEWRPLEGGLVRCRGCEERGRYTVRVLEEARDDQNSGTD